MITAYREGATAASLTAAHGVSLNSVKRLLHTAGARRTSPTRRSTKATPSQPSQLQNTPFDGLMDGMNDSDRNTRSSLPAVVVPRPVMRARRTEQRPTQWHSGRLPDRLRRASQHPAVASSLATAAGLMLHAGLRWALAPQGRSAQIAGSAVTRVPSAVPHGGSLMLFRRTVVVKTWAVRDHRT